MILVRLAIDRWSCEFSSAEDGARLRVVDDRGRGADVRHEIAELVALESGRRRLTQLKRVPRPAAARRRREARARLVRVGFLAVCACLAARFRSGVEPRPEHKHQRAKDRHFAVPSKYSPPSAGLRTNAGSEPHESARHAAALEELARVVTSEVLASAMVLQ